MPFKRFDQSKGDAMAVKEVYSKFLKEMGNINDVTRGKSQDKFEKSVPNCRSWEFYRYSLQWGTSVRSLIKKPHWVMTQNDWSWIVNGQKETNRLGVFEGWTENVKMTWWTIVRKRIDNSRKPNAHFVQSFPLPKVSSWRRELAALFKYPHLLHAPKLLLVNKDPKFRSANL